MQNMDKLQNLIMQKERDAKCAFFMTPCILSPRTQNSSIMMEIKTVVAYEWGGH